MAENVLGALFGDIADAIREKTGDTATMKPADFPKQIKKIEASSIIDNVEIQLDFSNGDMNESLPEGYSAQSVTILKPPTLVAENIAEGVEIAQIVGTHKGSGGNGGEKNIVYATGTLTWNGNGMWVQHGLGVVPDLVVIASEMEGVSGKAITTETGISTKFKEKSGSSFGVRVYQYDGATATTTYPIDQTNSMASYVTYIHMADSTRFLLSAGSTMSFVKGNKLTWEAYGNLV